MEGIEFKDNKESYPDFTFNETTFKIESLDRDGQTTTCHLNVNGKKIRFVNLVGGKHRYHDYSIYVDDVMLDQQKNTDMAGWLNNFKDELWRYIEKIMEAKDKAARVSLETEIREKAEKIKTETIWFKKLLGN
jgi:hypothetical protein